jgi:hypothetical protein
MKKQSKVSTGFYLDVVATVLLIAALAAYVTVMNTRLLCFAAMAVGLLFGVIGPVGIKLAGGKELLQWMPCVAAVLAGFAAMSSATVMVDPIGYVVSGLYLFSDIQSYVIYLALAVAAIVLYLIAGFVRLSK